MIGYTLSLAVFIPAAGRLSDRYGNKRVFLFALATFVTASALCGAAQNIEQLIGFRVLQGIGGGMLTPVALGMLFRVFPPAERARVSTLMMVPTLAAPALGPVIGGSRWRFGPPSSPASSTSAPQAWSRIPSGHSTASGSPFT